MTLKKTVIAVLFLFPLTACNYATSRWNAVSQGAPVPETPIGSEIPIEKIEAPAEPQPTELPTTEPLPPAVPTTPPPAAPAPLVPEWPLQVGTVSQERGQAVAADVQGDVYVAGWTDDGAAIDGFLIKYDTEGRELWRRSIGGAGEDFALALAFDLQGDLYVAGRTTDEIDGEPFAGGVSDLFIRKYRPDGNLVWNRLIGTADGEELTAMAHWKESLYLVGHGARDIAIWRVNQTDGSHNPAADFRDFDGSSASDRVRDVAADPDGNLFVVGETLGDFPHAQTQPRAGLPTFHTNRGGADGFLMHLDSDLTLIDTNVFGSAQDDVFHGVTAPDVSGLIIAGSTLSADLSHLSNTPAAASNRFVMNFSRSGSRYAGRWAAQSGLRAPEAALKARVDGHGDIWVLGSEGDRAVDADVFVTKYQGATGAVLFDRSIGSSAYDEPAAIALDPAGNAFVTGFTQGILGNTARDAAATDDDPFVIGIGPNGELL